MRIVPLIVELSGAPLDTENCRSPVSVPEKRSVEVCPSWVTVTGSVGNDVSTASTMVVSAPAILMFFTVNLLLALSGVLVLTSWEMGSSVSDVQESPTPTGSAGRGDAMFLTLFPIWAGSGEGVPATPPNFARTTFMRSSYTVGLVSPRIRSRGGFIAAGAIIGDSSVGE